MKIMAVGAHLDDIEIACGGTLAKAVRNSQITPRSTKKQSHRGSAIINLKFCKAGSNRPNSVYQSNIALHSVRFDKLSE